MKPIKIIILGALLVFAYASTWQWMWDRWFAYDSYYSHGVLIPFVSALLIWQKRHVFKALKPEPSPWGWWIFIAGMVVHWLSLSFRVYFSSGFSMPVVLAGLVLCFGGWKILREALFPIVFLNFMIPMPLVAVINFSFLLKYWSATMATAMLNFINIPALQEGSYIHMSHAIVVVEDVCSGLRSLIALMALGALFAYWIKAGKFKKVVLFLSAIPIALITNMVRIVWLAFISEFWGTQYITGLVHQLLGLLVFVLAFFLLSGMEKLLTGRANASR